MPLEIIRNDITKLKTDAIVNAANPTLLGGGGVDGAIHKAAGKKLLLECAGLGGCKTGQAKITGAYNLPCKYVIHTVGPKWHGGDHNEPALLENCYKNSLALALRHNIKSIAFPLISSGVYGYPKAQALKVAVDTIRNFLLYNDMQVYIVIFDKSSAEISKKLYANVKEYIDDIYAGEHAQRRSQILSDRENASDCQKESRPMTAPVLNNAAAKPIAAHREKTSSDEIDRMLDESFRSMLLRKIDEKGIKDSQCYKKAGIDRKLFSKIKNDKNYKPSKETVISFSIALALSLTETKEMLMKAGYALSHSNKFDIIIEYFIRNHIYDLFQINETLFEFDQKLLGC